MYENCKKKKKKKKTHVIDQQPTFIVHSSEFAGF